MSFSASIPIAVLVLASAVRLSEWAPRVVADALAHPFFAALALGIGALAALPSLATMRARVARLVFDSPRFAFDATIFAAAATGAALASWGAFDATPFLDDDVAALFQARIFATGAILRPLPNDPPFFEVFGVLGAKVGLDHWCGMYPPGWPALLAIGAALGAPWLVNPVVAGALAVTASRLGERSFDRATGRIAGCLIVVSPMVIGLAATHLSNLPAALFAALALLFVIALYREGSPIHGLAAGAALGMVLLCRPLDAVLLGSVFALPFLLSPRLLRERALGIALGLGAAAFAAALLLAFQWVTTGDPMLPGHKLGMGRWGRFGFMPLWGERVHDGARALEHTGLRLTALDRGALGGLLPATFGFLVALALGRGERARIVWLAAPTAVLASTYAFFWYFDLYVPGRYLAASLAMVVVIGARAFVLAAERGRSSGAIPDGWVPGVACAAILWSVSIGIPSQLRLMVDRVGDVEPVLARVVEAYDLANAVVFIDAIGTGRNDADHRNDFYATGFVRNDLDLAGDVVFARNLRSANPRLLARYPGRDAYLYRYLRFERKAQLYRLRPCDAGYALEQVRPIRYDLLVPDPSRRTVGACEREGTPRATS